MKEETINNIIYSAQERIKSGIDRKLLSIKREMAVHDLSYAKSHNFSKEYVRKVQKRSFKYLIPQYTIHIIVRDREHFYSLVNWCNKNIGKGQQCWTVRGNSHSNEKAILKYIDPCKTAYSPPVT